MKDRQTAVRSLLMRRILWFVSWLILVILSLDLFNWGRPPRFYLGLPGWLWWDVGIVLLTALAFGLLSRFAWVDE